MRHILSQAGPDPLEAGVLVSFITAGAGAGFGKGFHMKKSELRRWVP